MNFRIMLRHLLTMGILLTSMNSFADDVVIRKIKILGNTFTKEDVILNAFIEVSEGQKIPETVLPSALESIERRLKDTGYFYSVLVQSVNSATQLGAINIIVEVEEGFLWRFGGGAVYGSFGAVNLFGQAKEYNVILGLKKQSFEFTDKKLFMPGLAYSLGLSHDIGQWIQRSGVWNDSKELSLSAKLSKDLGWGWKLSTGGKLINDYALLPIFKDYYYRQELEVAYSHKIGGFSPNSGGQVRLYADSVFPVKTVNVNMEMTTYMSLEPVWTKFALRLQGTAQVLNQSTLDRFLNLSTGENRVRRNPSGNDLSNAYALTNIEWRGMGWKIPFLSFSTITLEPVLFYDIGMHTYYDPVEWQLKYAYGCGVHLNFEAPINVPFRVEVSWDDKKNLYLIIKSEILF